MRRARLNPDVVPPAEPEPRRPLLALTLTLWVQALTACTLTIVAVLAPAVAPTLGLRVEQIGLFVGLCYVLAMLSGLITSAYVPRFGPLRLSQAALIASAAALALMTAGMPMAFLGAAVLIGWGYGLTNPTSAAMLGEHTPPKRRGLFFSIKQTGVPLGIAMAGSLGPVVFDAAGWRTTLLALAALCVTTALAMQPVRSMFDRSLSRTADPRLLTLLRPLRTVFERPGLRRLSLVSLVFAMVQVCLLTFLVAMLHLAHGIGLAQAAGMLAVAQITSIAARPGWGWVADRWQQPARLLGLLGIGMGVSCAILAGLPVGTPASGLIAVTMACAATAIGWNGVYYAELVQQAAPGELATVTGACQFMTFMGPMLGPPVFAQVVYLTDSYSPALQMLAALGFGAGVWMLSSVRRDERAILAAEVK